MDMALPDGWEKRLADVHWHTVSEQFVMPRLLEAAKLDLVHIPYHNPPMFYSGRMIVTIHDLTILHFNTGRATTLPLPLYQLKRMGYWMELAVGLEKAERVVAVSEATKREVMDHFRVSPEKISVTYEGVDSTLSRIQDQASRIIQDPYILYVGNAYPHKNLETLLTAWNTMKTKLVLVGNDDFFYQRLRKTTHLDSVVFFGPANDGELANLYQNAKAFISPSLMEGFGLPALEALSFGCPVVASDISVFHEILGEYATYVDPHDPKSMVHALTHIKKPDRVALQKFLASYSWSRMAKETLELYERSARV
jgi:glycosyltransferase involved in cell wall biosynthesis